MSVMLMIHWGTGIRGLMRGLATSPPAGNEEPSVIKTRL